MTDRLLSDTEVAGRVPISRTQRWRLEKRGEFPARIRIGDPNSPSGRVAWSESEIMKWIADRMAARGAARGRRLIPRVAPEVLFQPTKSAESGAAVQVRLKGRL